MILGRPTVVGYRDYILESSSWEQSDVKIFPHIALHA
jgi:hypothetical protein